MKLDRNGISNRLNPFFFYLAFMLHNYAIKKTNNTFIFLFSFVPSSIYVLIKTSIGNLGNFTSFKQIYCGTLIGLLDFLIVYIYSNIMRTFSTFLCQSIFILPVIASMLPSFYFQSFFTFMSVVIIAANMKFLGDFEGAGTLFSKQSMPFIKLISDGDIIFMFFLILCFRIFVAWLVQTQNSQPDTLVTCSMFFLALISLLYGVFNYQTKEVEKMAFAQVRVPVVLSCCFYILFLFTMSSSGRQKHVFYLLFFVCLNIYYFLDPKNSLFLITRVEDALYLVFLGIFLCIFLLLAYTSLWYWFYFKEVCQDYDTFRKVEYPDQSSNLDGSGLQEGIYSISDDEEQYV
ncbi:hypothetical protein NGRA_1475 [Nosema granulosis]|uniref:Transmembrane protein n=1 Tax=Nosema granulosis TaxID=83296 RepID=A0A9P6GZD3_9MICR|nr:hypothetical protein NGRA_1475 [Nosema granulosis]